jgi:putative transposase
VTYRSSDKTVCSAKYHIIWCPSTARRVPLGQVEARSKQIIAEALDEACGQVIEVEVISDHVHLLVEVGPALTPSRLVQTSKGRSSRALRAELGPLRRLAARPSPSGFVSTVDGAPVAVVGRSVENEKAAA